MAEVFSSWNREVVGICGMSKNLEGWWESGASDVRDPDATEGSSQGPQLVLAHSNLRGLLPPASCLLPLGQVCVPSPLEAKGMWQHRPHI